MKRLLLSFKPQRSVSQLIVSLALLSAAVFLGAQQGLLLPRAASASHPEVALTSPADGETVSGTVSLEATASDDIGVAYVEFYVDGFLLESDATSPYAASWDTTGLAHGSSHTIIARAYEEGSAGGDADNDGFTNGVESYLGTHPGSACPATPTADDEAVDAWPPDFDDDRFITSGDLSQVAARVGQTVPPAAQRYDLNADGFITGDDLDLVAAVIGQGCTQPNFGESAAVTVTVIDITPPEVSVTSPADGSTVPRRATTMIVASAFDVSGVDRVEFRVDDSLQCTDSVEPYECAWDVPARPSASYILEARAYDAVGNTALHSISVQSSQAGGG